MLDCTSEGGEREAGAPVPPLTVGAALARAAGRLARAGVEEASLEAQLLLAHASGLERARLLAHPELPLERVAADGFRDLIARRTRGVPLAYLTGWREFYGRPFQVSPAALIPRPESELLVDLALEELRRFAAETRPRLLDLGTGSGALAISIALAAPHTRVFASDLSAAALGVATANARRLGARVWLFQGDLLQPLRAPLDLLVANLPYLSPADLAAAPPEVRAHEPSLALVGGARGTELIERLLPRLATALRPGGAALLEIGWLQAAALRRRARAALPGADVQVLRDYAGLDRVLRVRRG